MTSGHPAASIRRARRRDWRALKTLFREIFPDAFPGSALGARIAVDFRNAFLAEREGSTRGFFTMSVNNDPSEAWLDYLGVIPSVRREGVGKVLLAHFEDTARQRGFVRAGLAVRKTNGVARALYESNGYTVEGEDGQGWILGKSLSGPHPGGPSAGRLVRAPRPIRLLDRALYGLWVH